MASSIDDRADGFAIIEHGVDADEGVIALDEGCEAFENELAAADSSEPIVGEGDAEFALWAVGGGLWRKCGVGEGDLDWAREEGSEVLVATGGSRHQR